MIIVANTYNSISKVFSGSCTANDKKIHDRFKWKCSKRKNKTYLKYDFPSIRHTDLRKPWELSLHIPNVFIHSLTLTFPVTSCINFIEGRTDIENFSLKP